jgi:hypothetical protein
MKRPAVNLADLTAAAALPMSEAAQRAAQPIPSPVAAVPTSANKEEATKTADLQSLAFKVPGAFRRRFRQRAADADLKLNQLLFEALDAWEEKKGLKG